MTSEYEKEVAKFCRRLMNRHLSECDCMFDYANSEPVDGIRYYITAEYATPLLVREQWALTWCDL